MQEVKGKTIRYRTRYLIFITESNFPDPVQKDKATSVVETKFLSRRLSVT